MPALKTRRRRFHGIDTRSKKRRQHVVAGGGPASFCTPGVKEFDLRVGGRWRFAAQGAAGRAPGEDELTKVVSDMTMARDSRAGGPDGG
ncbi:MAG TPA: hypothetical protein VHZ56_12035 [Devosia sp.]|nr:hypothetical protein [Devosia sp.]